MTKKLIFALMALVMLTAAQCKDGVPQDLAFDSPLCGDVQKFTASILKYGDGVMTIVASSRVHEESVFVIALSPESGFRNANVTVTGTGVDAGWINGSGTYNGLPKGPYPRAGMLEVGCAPEVPDDKEEVVYKFKIEVVEGDVTNILDPRAVVVKN